MQQDQYDYEEDGTYCYPGTDVLKNKLNIRDKVHYPKLNVPFPY